MKRFYLDETSPSGLSHVKYGHCVSIHRDGHYTVCFRVNGKQVRKYVHRIIWELIHGSIDDNLDIDHIDGVKTNNKIENLRLVTRKVNLRNQKTNSRNTSGFTGVSLLEVNGYSYWSASWLDESGKQKTKRFSIAKLGDKAKELAIEHRTGMIELINKTSDSKYTVRHYEEK
jgi:hypothetical protein